MRVGIQTGIGHKKDPKQSDLGLRCLPRPFWQIPSVQNVRTFTST